MKCCPNPIGSLLLGLVAVASLLPSPARAQPLLLSHFRFEGNGLDDLANSPPMFLSDVTFTNGAMLLPCTNIYNATASIAGFSYTSFTVSLDFKPSSFDLPDANILCGGPAYRWLGLEVYAGQFRIALNNWNRVYAFTNSIALNQWHTVVCAVDLPSQSIIAFLDGERLQDIQLQNFTFEVIGTSFEQSDKAFSFWNPGVASRFCGWTDNLRVYSRALSPPEIAALYAVHLSIQRSGQSILVYWPADLTGFVLESAHSLAGATVWSNDSRSPVVIGTQMVFVDASTIGSKYYRLRRE
jgi:Concanavalin A-like lectin/glucanases superfamily